MKIGIVGSSGGSALATANECLMDAGIKIDWFVTTDRECEMKKWAKCIASKHLSISAKDNNRFSVLANNFFENNGCEHVLLFFSRLISEPLISDRNVYNIHPSLLPSFKGLTGLKDTIAYNSKVFGATLHYVDNGIDTGRIIGQVAAPTGVMRSRAMLEFISYQQKVWLTLVFLEHLRQQTIEYEMQPIWPAVLAASPAIGSSMLRDAFVNRMELEISRMVG